MIELDRPLVTFALIAFNQKQYVGEAIAAAFMQTYSPLEIILSDDCSTDETFNIMKHAAAEYKGPHRIVLNRNTHNLNIGAHVNKVAELALGKLIVLAAGDDVSVSMRTEKLTNRWLDLGSPPAVLYSDFDPIDKNSRLVNLPYEKIYRGPCTKKAMSEGVIQVLGATTAIAKTVFSKFPPMDSKVRHEDRVLPFRSMLLGGAVILVDEKLVCYRVEGGISRGQPKTAKEALFDCLAAATIRTLPDAIQRLADLDFIAPDDLATRRACLKTIADFKARLELIETHGYDVELCVIKWLGKGARPIALIKIYLKIRFYKFFNIYFKYRLRR